MEPNRFGRVLGIGVRVASRMVKERATQAAAAPTAAANGSTYNGRPQAPPPPPTQSRPAKDYKEPARRVGVGTRRFGQAFFGPFARVGGTLWLEITGLFFALFTLFFAQNAYRLHASMRSGPDHTRFVLYCAIGAVFLYFSLSSFVKANRRGRRRSR